MWVENTVEKEKLLVTSNSSFSHSDFKRLVLQTRKNQSLFGKGLNSSKFKEFAADNFKFDENSRKFSKREENIVGKEEIARYEQFLCFPQCFQKTCTADT